MNKKNASFAAAVLLILIANAVALIHAARNRSGSPTADIVLTQRELSYYANTNPDSDDSAVTLHLRSDNAANYGLESVNWGYQTWLDTKKLQALGFDCSVDPKSPKAGRFYERQRARRAFIALEYDGPAWHAWLDGYARARANSRIPSPDFTKEQTHLVAIDADLNAAALRGRHPDRSNVIVLPGLVAIELWGVHSDKKEESQLSGIIREMPSAIHVPLPFSDQFRHRFPRNYRHESELGYRVHLKYGSSLESWIDSVEF